MDPHYQATHAAAVYQNLIAQGFSATEIVAVLWTAKAIAEMAEREADRQLNATAAAKLREQR